MRVKKSLHGTLVAYLALFFALSGTAIAATGGNFLLGKTNSAGTTSQLKNTGTGAALGLTAKAGTPALSVNGNKTRIPALNADLIDGVHASGLTQRVFASYRNGPVFVPFSTTTKTSLGHLALPVGTWMVFGKAWVQSNAGAGTSEVQCDLNLTPGGNFDSGQVDLTDGNVSSPDQPVRNGILQLNVNGVITSAGAADLNCQNRGGGNTYLKFIKLTALSLNSLSSVAQP